MELQEPVVWKEGKVLGKIPEGKDEIKLLCYVVTMPQRCENVTKRAIESNVPCTIMGAMDGTGIYPPPKLNEGPVALLSQYGCFESNRRALQAFVSLPKDIATHLLIIEDDVVYPKKFDEYVLTRIRLLSNHVNDWEMLYLIYTHEYHPDETRQVAPGLDIFTSRLPRSTAAYISTRDSALKLLSITKDWKMPIDEIYAGTIGSGGIKSYMIWPSLLSYVNSASTIWESSTKAVVTTGRLFTPEVFTCCCYDDETKKICSFVETCQWDPVAPNCQHYRSKEAGEICDKKCNSQFGKKTGKCGYWAVTYDGFWDDRCKKDICRGVKPCISVQQVAAISNIDVANEELMNKALSTKKLIYLDMKGEGNDNSKGLAKLQCKLVIVLDIITKDMHIFPENGWIRIKFKDNERILPQFPENPTICKKKGDGLYSVMVKRSGFTFSGMMKFTEKAKKGMFDVSFKGNMGSKGSFEMFSQSDVAI